VNIYIPTYGRVGKQITLAALSPSARKRTWLVVRPEERTAHNWPRMLVCEKKGVPAARQEACKHALREGSRFAFFFDDDLHFSIRPPTWCFETNEVSLRKATCMDIAAGLCEAESWLKHYPMVGFDARAGNNRCAERNIRLACRVMRAFGVDVPLMFKLGIAFDHFPFWEDFHVGLSFLEKGYLNANLTRYTNDGVTNSEGGVSTYRNLDKMKACLSEFIKLHPCAKAVYKKTKWRGMENVAVPDMMVFWKKAAQKGGAL